MAPHAGRLSGRRKGRTAFRFVLLRGILSFFADFTYEGSRSILGPFLLSLQASAAVVGIVTGFGELLGYALRLASGWLHGAFLPWAKQCFDFARPPLALLQGSVHIAGEPEIARQDADLANGD